MNQPSSGIATAVAVTLPEWVPGVVDAFPACTNDTGRMRLAITLALMTIGSVGMYVVPVVLPAVQADFGVARADASLPYTLLMIGFGLGGMVMGRLADRFGVSLPLAAGAVGLGLGFAAAAMANSIWMFALAHGALVGFVGSSATYAPLIADTSMWFVRRRGIAVAICASGNYLGGAIWPPVVQHFVETSGWRATYFGLALFCALAMAGLADIVVNLSWLGDQIRSALGDG